MVLEILFLVQRNRYRWTSNKMNMTLTAVHLPGLAAKDFSDRTRDVAESGHLKWERPDSALV